MIDELMAQMQLKPSQLDVCAFGAGPGSFTGLRIAAAVTQAIAVSADLPVVPVSTLRALAQGAYRLYQHKQILAAIDARMQEVYWAVCKLDENELMQVIGEEYVIAPDKVPLPENGEWVGAGSGWRSYKDKLDARINTMLISVKDELWPQAQDILTLDIPMVEQGKVVAAEFAEPVYLRDNVAKSIVERKAEQKPS